VFGLLDEPVECVRGSPSQSFENVTRLPGGGHEYDYTFRMAGVPLTGHVETTVHDPPASLEQTYTGDIDATIAFDLAAPDGDRTVLSAEATYELPGRVLEAVAGPVVERYNRGELDDFVENTRERVETAYDPTGDAYGDYGLDGPWRPEPLPAPTEGKEP
jgi:hypothetical protein